MAMADGARKTIVVPTAPASPPEVPRIPDTLAQTFTTELPERMIGDQAYDVPALVPTSFTPVRTEADLIPWREPLSALFAYVRRR